MEELKYLPIYDDETQRKLQGQFSRVEGECYVDHAGCTLYSDDQIKGALSDLTKSLFTNPHSSGVNGNVTEELIDNIRYRILDHFKADQNEYSVIFTSGATASLKLVAETFDFSNEKDGLDSLEGNFVYLQDNHTSVLGMREIVSTRGANVTCLEHDEAFELFRRCEAFKRNQFDSCRPNSLFVYSAQCNFSGLKYPLEWISKVKEGCLHSLNQTTSNWFTLLDAASFAATSELNLSKFKPDFICVSFYKMFGYPTGLGALIVKNESSHLLKKVYYGGGTVEVALSSKMYHVKKKSLHQRFEDGTIPFLSIASLQYGFNILTEIPIQKISGHVFSLARYLHHCLLTLHHQNNAPVIKLYSDSDYEDSNVQGGIVTFNVLRANGEFVGYMEVLSIAALFKIHLRTGCFCNPGACQRHLNLTDDEILKNYDAGYTCGGDKDLIDGKPTGAVRVSFGYMSTVEDVNTILRMLKKCFVSGTEIVKYPSWWPDLKLKFRTKYQLNRDDLSEVDGLISYTDIDKNISILHESEAQEHYNSASLSKNISTSTGSNSPVLSRIFIYPIKSCGRYEIKSSWELTSKGLQYDREWMITTSAGVCLTQKQEPRLCLIKPIIDIKNDQLILQYPGMPTIEVPLNIHSDIIQNNKLCRGKICGHKVEGVDCGAEISEWLSLALGRPNIKLVQQSEPIKSPKEKSVPKLSFASQSQYLLINESSVSWLNDRLPEDAKCDEKTLIHRFRGNLIIKGSLPFEELTWSRVSVGNCEFEVAGLCTRCQMICIDQTTGEKTVEPLRTLAEEFHGKLKFGIYLVNNSSKNHVISVGDQISFS
ncbi:hypothetical protein QAD02_018498 [Eretmocerus hayati]|uniref:Uncharacterized protein n=1 Tax=Eretmocerus hayati TaxID=131215 RepID=A0ACC2PIQ9_9HYME|nr:hypothetical protein QAD02_018498 [Eretmocerus hayati]